MWESVYISQTIENAKDIEKLLKSNDILVKIIRKSKDDIQIFVPSAELSEAQELILSN